MGLPFIQPKLCLQPDVDLPFFHVPALPQLLQCPVRQDTLVPEISICQSPHGPVVHWVICDYIHVNPTICGLEYSDLFQEGCVWLCKAAATYKDDGRAQFATYAKTVVKNGLLSYCRTICNRGKMFSRLIIGEHGELAADGEALEPQSDAFDAQVSLMETLSLLEASKQDYDGVARLGIEALALKLQGMRVTDIAELYQVPPSHVGAWISRSVAKLRSDPRFLASLL